jgi:hypothetical protein
MSWLSKQLKKSKRKGTGIYSWGDSNLAKGLDLYVPGLGTGLDTALDALGSTAGGGKSGPTLPPPKILSSQEVQNQNMMMYIGGAILLYFVLK